MQFHFQNRNCARSKTPLFRPVSCVLLAASFARCWHLRLGSGIYKTEPQVAKMIDGSLIEASKSAAPVESAAFDRAFVPSGCQYGPSFHWLCIVTNYGDEQLADQQLRRRGLCTWLPMHLDHDRIRPLFPTYLFAQADLDADLWRSIRRQPGVFGLLGMHNERPATVPDRALQILWADCAANGVIYPTAPPIPDRSTPIATGAAVTLTSGAFSGLSGICRWSSTERVAILMQVLGAAVKVTVPRESVAVV